MAEYSVYFEAKVSGNLVDVEANDKDDAKVVTEAIIKEYMDESCPQLEDYDINFTNSKWNIEMTKGGDFNIDISVYGSQIDNDSLEEALRDTLSRFADDVSVDIEVMGR